jgi:uncharacterized protein (TIGR03085 family)
MAAAGPGAALIGPLRRGRVPYDRLMTHARDERLALCALLDDVGPDAPTMCAGWRTADLAAHLVLRERRPDAGAGVLGGPLAGHTRRVQRRLTARTPYPALVDAIRTGPPRLSLFAIPGVDQRANLTEYFVHHEDVRRAQPGWEPRRLDPGLSELLWQGLRTARFILRKSPVGIELARDDDNPDGGSGQPRRVRITARARTPVVTVTGPPAELALWTMGRTTVARVRLDGSDADVRALASATWRV